MAERTAFAKVSPNWENVPESVRSSPFGSMVIMTPSVEVPVAGSPDRILVMPKLWSAAVLASVIVMRDFVSAQSVSAQFVNTNRLMVPAE